MCLWNFEAIWCTFCVMCFFPGIRWRRWCMVRKNVLHADSWWALDKVHAHICSTCSQLHGKKMVAYALPLHARCERTGSVQFRRLSKKRKKCTSFFSHSVVTRQFDIFESTPGYKVFRARWDVLRSNKEKWRYASKQNFWNDNKRNFLGRFCLVLKADNNSLTFWHYY